MFYVSDVICPITRLLVGMCDTAVKCAAQKWPNQKSNHHLFTSWTNTHPIYIRGQEQRKRYLQYTQCMKGLLLRCVFVVCLLFVSFCGQVCLLTHTHTHVVVLFKYARYTCAQQCCVCGLRTTRISEMCCTMFIFSLVSKYDSYHYWSIYIMPKLYNSES